MATRLARLTSPHHTEKRQSWDEFTELVIANTWTATLGGERDDYIRFFERNPIVFAAVRQRQQMFSQAVFKWQRIRNGRPGDLWGNDALAIFEQPQPMWATSDLLTLWELDVSLHGNAYAWEHRTGELTVPRPDAVSAITEEVRESESGPVLYRRLSGYMVNDDRMGPGRVIDPRAEKFAHFLETPDPRKPWKGVSWVRAVCREARADDHLTDYKIKFFEYAATPNLAIKSEKPLTDEQFDRLQEQVSRRHEGVDNAHRTLIIEGGADIEKVGAGLGELSYTQIQDAGENRIALASGVPAPLIGIQLGTNPTYNNFNTARRHFADAWARPQWRKAAGALSAIQPAPRDSRLWYDDRDIEALQQDADDEAAIRQKDAATLRQLVDGGFTPESAVQFVSSSDPSVLEHTGNLSVQLLPNGQADI